MTFSFLNWNQAAESNSKTCGGKAWNLARLNHYGFKIPRGGVITTALYQSVILQNPVGSLIQKIKELPIGEINNSEVVLFDEVEQAFLESQLPQDFDQTLTYFLEQQGIVNSALAIRSSATMEDGADASFAGIHESYLNIQSIAEIKIAMRKCFASLWTRRAVAYRRKLGIEDGEVEAAVIISELIDAEISGVAFSCDPSGNERDAVVINANYGLGESVVSGLVEPDEFVIDRFHNREIKSHIGKKEKIAVTTTNGTTLINREGEIQPSLNVDQLKQLVRLVDRVFHAVGQGTQHQDIEWALSNDEFVLLQTRPVTKIRDTSIDIGEKHSIHWCNGNFRDSLPMVLGVLGAEFSGYRIDSIMHTMFEGWGYKADKAHHFRKNFNGRFYCNSTLLQWLYYDAIGFSPSLTCLSLGGHQDVLEIPKSYKTGIRKELVWLVRKLKYMRLRDGFINRRDEIFTRVTQFNNTLRNKDLSCLSNEELVDDLKLIEQQMDVYDKEFMFLTSASGAALILVQILTKYFAEKTNSIVNALLEGDSNITSANHGYELIDLARIAKNDSDTSRFFESENFNADDWKNGIPDNSAFMKAFDHYLQQYGHRAVYEMDLSQTRWREDPSYLIQCIKGNFDALATPIVDKVKKESGGDVWLLVKEKVPFYLRPMIKKLVKEAKQGAALKEESKSHYAKYMEVLRYVLLEIANRLLLKNVLNERDDLFHCSRSELISILYGEWNGEQLKSIVEERKKIKLKLEKLDAPDIVIDDQAKTINSQSANNSKDLIGVGVATGIAQGVARIINNPKDGARLNHGDVLVAPSTDPSWTPLFLNASAIVMETGGFLSHGSIVAREYGIPAVVNVAGAMRAITDGDLIEVNGDAGIVNKTV